MTTFSVYLRWSPHWKEQHAFGRAYIHVVGEVEAQNLADAKAKAVEFQSEYDLGFLELLLTRGSNNSTFMSGGMTSRGMVIARQSPIYHYPSRRDAEKADRSWDKISKKGGVV